jgi:hypothetical protein
MIVVKTVANIEMAIAQALTSVTAVTEVTMPKP